jgi:hypothetical protein
MHPSNLRKTTSTSPYDERMENKTCLDSTYSGRLVRPVAIPASTSIVKKIISWNCCTTDLPRLKNILETRKETVCN